jgi:hypothetical protein
VSYFNVRAGHDIIGFEIDFVLQRHFSPECVLQHIIGWWRRVRSVSREAALDPTQVLLPHLFHAAYAFVSLGRRFGRRIGTGTLLPFSMSAEGKAAAATKQATNVMSTVGHI